MTHKMDIGKQHVPRSDPTEHSVWSGLHCLSLIKNDKKIRQPLNISKVGRVQYLKFPKYSDTQKLCCNQSKSWTMWFYYSVMSPNFADGMANSVDPDQTAPLGGVQGVSKKFVSSRV